MRTTYFWTFVGWPCLVLMCVVTSAQARPLYSKVFREVYPNWNADVTKCAICHDGATKKNRNDYGKAVEEALEGKNIKDVEAIKAALKKAEGKLPKPKPKK